MECGNRPECSEIDRPFTAPDGTKYANLRNPAIREALGVIEVADPPAYDQRFYCGRTDCCSV